ncbi:sensor histidine kinase [Methylobacterium sp. 10]|uniref:sensor histidine kinase n=1 Tax=Methylobacterium sp. 10 TaxID=1101191 RepID=UPI000480C113|nr:sensor histidine kinase [Methylobacterium sp. 10]
MTMGSDPMGATEQVVLLAELQHRVRNTLATMRLIARRSAEFSESLEDYTAHLDGRLAAMARVQNVIIQNPTAGVDLDRLVTDELTSALAYQDGRTHVDGPDLRLHLRAAEPLALALHELSTNALKFGALATPTGRLAVTWRIEDRDGGPRLILDWVESGVPLDEHEARRRGFGTVVLEEMLAYNLKAATSLTFASDGLHYRLTLPLTSRTLQGGTGDSSRLIHPLDGQL